MRAEYDASADAYYLYVVEPLRAVDHTGTMVNNDDIFVDFDAQGHVLGIEVLNASERLTPEVLAAAERIGE